VYCDESLRITAVPDRMDPVAGLLLKLSESEQKQAVSYSTERGKRHFVLGRIAAHHAVALSLLERVHMSDIEVLSDTSGKPLVCVDGSLDVASVSISHSGRLAIACAWLCTTARCYSAGVDIERVRTTSLAQNPYAFSRPEQALISRAKEGQTLASLAVWVAKEAIWKALRPERHIGSEAIEIRAVALKHGSAAVEVSPGLAARLGNSVPRVRLGSIIGPDGLYLLAVAEVVPGGCKCGKAIIDKNGSMTVRQEG
jgi:phosphopantetheinyl transferase (holo-ACP synthase)